MRTAATIAIVVARVLIASLGVVTVVFLALRLAGDPVAIAMPPGTPLDVEAMYRKAWGLDGSLLEQYWRFVARLARGDLGPSIAFDRPAVAVIGEHLAITLRLMAGAFAVAVGYVYANAAFFWIAVEKRRYAGMAAVLGSLNSVLFALSDFVLAIVAIVVFGLLLGVSFSPESGGWNFVIGSFCVGLPFGAYFSILSRRLAEDLVQDPKIQFFTDAASTNFANFHRLFLPIFLGRSLSLLLLRFVWLAAGTFIVESVLGIRGMGYLTIRSVAQRDINITQGVVLLVAGLSVVANVIADAIERRNKRGAP